MSNQEKVKQLKDKGNAALKAGRHQKAIKYYSLAINLDPTNHVLYSIRGAAHCKAGNNRKAAADVKKSVSLNSAWVKTYSRKGDALAQLRKYKDALNVYREGLKFYPNNQQLKDGIKEVQVQMSQSQFTSGFPNPFCGKRNFFEKLKNDPRTKDCFNDPNYLKLLSDLQSNLQSMLTNMKDPRAMTTLNVLLGIDLFDATGAGNNVEVDTPSKPELSKSPEVELSKSPEVELSDENKKKPYSEVQVFEPLSVIDKQWELIDPHPDINLLLQEFDKRFFEGKLKSVEVKWDEEMTWCAGECSYKGGCSIRLSAPLHKFRPRKDLVETLLHEMIHAYVFISGIKETDDHGPQFLTHMARINEESGANVTVYHDFLNEVDYYRPYSWKCNGPCKNKYPHYGVIHRAVNRPPGPEDKWWSEHQIKCGGTFVKRKKHVTASGKDKVSAVTKKKYSNKVSAIAKRKYSIPVPKFGILTKRISAEWNQVYQIGAGLTNLGNSCFMNSVIQCLTYCPPLANYLFHNDHHISKCALTGFCLMCLLQNHMEKVMGKSGEVVKPLDIYQRLILLSKHFHLGRQEDAHEFLRCFIYHLWQSCSTDYNGVKSDFTTTEMTIIHQIFGGFHRSEVICLSCKEKSCEFFYCTDVMLDIDGDIASLENALAKFIEPASLQQENSYQCPFCEMKVKAQKTLTFFQPPVTAIFVLKRFHHNLSSDKKITKQISYPERLDLQPYMYKPQGDPKWYCLNAIIVHEGALCNSGHYYCYVKNSDGSWYIMDDSKVLKVPLDVVLKQSAYILFYNKMEKKNLDNKSNQIIPDKEQISEKLANTEKPDSISHGFQTDATATQIQISLPENITIPSESVKPSSKDGERKYAKNRIHSKSSSSTSHKKIKHAEASSTVQKTQCISNCDNNSKTCNTVDKLLNSNKSPVENNLNPEKDQRLISEDYSATAECPHCNLKIELEKIHFHLKKCELTCPECVALTQYKNNHEGPMPRTKEYQELEGHLVKTSQQLMTIVRLKWEYENKPKS